LFTRNGNFHSAIREEIFSGRNQRKITCNHQQRTYLIIATNPQNIHDETAEYQRKMGISLLHWVTSNGSVISSEG
jgi:hypothetical protein